MPTPFEKLEATKRLANETITNNQDKCDAFVDSTSLRPDIYNPDWSQILEAAEAAGLRQAVELVDNNEGDIPEDYVAQVRDSDVVAKCKNDPENTFHAWGIPEELYETLTTFVEYQRDMVVTAINVYADAINAALFEQTNSAETTNPASEPNSDWDDVMQSFHSDAYIKEED